MNSVLPDGFIPVESIPFWFFDPSKWPTSGSEVIPEIIRDDLKKVRGVRFVEVWTKVATKSQEDQGEILWDVGDLVRLDLVKFALEGDDGKFTIGHYGIVTLPKSEYKTRPWGNNYVTFKGNGFGVLQDKAHFGDYSRAENPYTSSADLIPLPDKAPYGTWYRLSGTSGQWHPVK